MKNYINEKYSKNKAAFVVKGEDRKLQRSIIQNGELIKFKDYFTIKAILKSEYIDFYGVSAQAVDYICKSGAIDSIKIGTTRVILLTNKTREYVPNSSKKRTSTMNSVERV